MLRTLHPWRVILIPWPSDLSDTSPNKQETLTTALQRVSASKTNLSIEPLYSVPLTCTLSPLGVHRFLGRFKAMSVCRLHMETRCALAFRRRDGICQEPWSVWWGLAVPPRFPPAVAHSFWAPPDVSCPALPCPSTSKARLREDSLLCPWARAPRVSRETLSAPGAQGSDSHMRPSAASWPLRLSWSMLRNIPQHK